MSGRLRIVAGTLGGRLFDCPQVCARPTTDRVREALFSTLTSQLGSFEGLSVCDAFAGSGALGFEALSRGAMRAQFFETDMQVIATLQRNAVTLGVRDGVHISRRNVLGKGIDGPFAPYNVVFLDPPYETPAEEVLRMLEKATEDNALAPDALIVYEHATERDALPESRTFTPVKSKAYGKTTISLYATSNS